MKTYKNVKDLTYFVVPCFNEFQRWNHAYWNKLVLIPEIFWLFVDDGSTDATSTLLAPLGEHKNVMVLKMETNSGKSEAVRAGFNLLMGLDSQPKVIGFLDGDSAFSIIDIKRFASSATQTYLLQYDAVWSSRVKMLGRNITRKPIRHFLARILSSALGINFHPMPYDSQSGLKIFKVSEALKKIVEAPFRTRWFFEIEMIIRWHKITGNYVQIWEEPVLSWVDVQGSKIRGKELLRVFLEFILIQKIKRKKYKWT